MPYLFIILSIVYFTLLIAIYVGLRRLKQQVTEAGDRSVSIVIAARNEENRILPCLQSLETLAYPQDKYEIIFVDDCSTDGTADHIQEYCQKHSHWNLIRLNEKSTELQGKKNALLNGIARAKNDLIFTTDADCVVSPGWLKKMTAYFQPGVSMVLGYSPLIPAKKPYFRLLQFDNLFSAIVSSAPTKLGYPFSSVGRNLTYRRDAYHDVGGFLSLKKFRSGDDTHLTSRFRYEKNGKIDFCADPDTFVLTRIPDSVSELFQQQVRKNSKTLHLSITSILLMCSVFFYYLCLFMLPVLQPGWYLTWLILVLLKFILEFISLYTAARIFRQSNLIKFIPLMQIIYPVYIIFFSLIGLFQFYHWKK